MAGAVVGLDPGGGPAAGHAVDREVVDDGFLARDAHEHRDGRRGQAAEAAEVGERGVEPLERGAAEREAGVARVCVTIQA